MKAEYLEIFKDRINIDANGYQILLTPERAKELIASINEALEQLRREYLIPNCAHEYEMDTGDLVCKKCGSWHPDF